MGEIMKRFLFFLLSITLMFVCINVNAQKRTKVADGVFLATYGNVTVIENDNTQQSIQIRVEKTGNDAYEVFCNNQFVKGATKLTLSKAIQAAIKVASQGVAGSWMTKYVIDYAVSYTYDKVCAYYAKQR